MKILHIGQLIGGLNIYIRNTIAYNKSEDFEFVIVTGKKDEHESIIKKGKAVKEYHISLYRKINPFRDIKGLYEVIKIIRKEKPDIIHCHSAKGGVIGRIAGWLTSTKTLYTPHAFSFLSTQNKLKKKIYIFIERICKFNSYLLACSESERQLGVNNIAYKEDHALVWNNSVPDARNSIFSTIEENYVCYIGRPSYQKNSLFFVDVVKKVHEKLPEVKFKLLGVGYYSPDLEQIKQRIADYNLANIIELLPWLNHEDTLKIVNSSKLYLTCSRYEGLPLAVIEAMSLGKPVIASKVLGNIDCVIDGENGFLLDLDVDSFTDKAIELLRDDNKRKGMGEASRKQFEEKFFIENRIETLVEIYKNT